MAQGWLTKEAPPGEQDDKSRMTDDCHLRICGGLRVNSLGLTRPKARPGRSRLVPDQTVVEVDPIVGDAKAGDTVKRPADRAVPDPPAGYALVSTGGSGTRDRPSWAGARWGW
jgi:hypothetical protein